MPRYFTTGRMEQREVGPYPVIDIGALYLIEARQPGGDIATAGNGDHTGRGVNGINPVSSSDHMGRQMAGTAAQIKDETFVGQTGQKSIQCLEFPINTGPCVISFRGFVINSQGAGVGSHVWSFFVRVIAPFTARAVKSCGSLWQRRLLLFAGAEYFCICTAIVVPSVHESQISPNRR
jgi:hypothetical protein